ncbi:VOC family protein [Bifidobacterium crudilactis]|jgi:hypothetical protein|uniref:VOC family protein n=1 Tax=Bifidobacterium crudilactis TaxID=327277 RepID=A0A971CYE5_9BIFI|nr:VOC family protein [Bifidobacterium crudilactis]MCI1664586.1 VOC family protein [Bifidobacterium crudilactis]MCI1869247.1 VOC family protein [Bifidobacterium crudilactis]MCI2148139.1 VOC family protein [Bifidobacterium crudilactis]MCI2157179.1 VOC family protein [Bifidobacterium crudilactis]MDN5972458.1 VOC family protein [Bifidobacterium crudilactis]
MSENLAWDHTMINVLDIDSQIRRFADLGIDFVRGGSHKVWGTQNALGYFGLNYIELISVGDRQTAWSFPRKNASAVYDATHDYQEGVERINTIAIRTHDIESTHQRLKKAGIPVGDVVDGRRLDESGHEIRWSIFFVNDTINGLPYPFFLEWPGTDQTREEQLVQQGLIVDHPAGNLRVKRVIFEVPDVLATAEVWSLITGSDAESIEHDGAIVHLCDRELVFRTGPANHITSLEFTGAGESLAGKSFGIGESSLNFL